MINVPVAAGRHGFGWPESMLAPAMNIMTELTMRRSLIFSLVLVAVGLAPRCVCAQAAAPAAAKLPTDWIDPATGHRIIRLSTEPGSASLYFHQNGYTPQGDKLVISTPEGLSSVDLKTHEIVLLAPGVNYGMGTSATVEVGRKTRTLYYERNGNGHTTLYAVDIDTKATRVIAALPFSGEFGGVTADEKLIIGKCSASVGILKDVSTTGNPVVEAPVPGQPPATQPARGARGARGAGGRGGGGAGAGLEFYAADIATGKVSTFFPMTEQLNHDQCSPTDPNLILYCHEGNWAQLDRIWTIHTDGTGNLLMHKRTMPMEIAGHEFFSPDGKMVWYDLQTPESGVFWVAGVNVYTGERIRYPLLRVEWSVHYNVSHDGKMFSGDGGGPKGVSSRLPDNTHIDPPANGQWMYLFRPSSEPTTTMKVDGQDVKVGKFITEKLVDLSKQDYTLEPNATFTPDDKWLVFRANFQGERHVYEVEIAKSTQAK